MKERTKTLPIWFQVIYPWLVAWMALTLNGNISFPPTSDNNIKNEKQAVQPPRSEDRHNVSPSEKRDGSSRSLANSHEPGKLLQPGTSANERTAQVTIEKPSNIKVQQATDFAIADAIPNWFSADRASRSSDELEVARSLLSIAEDGIPHKQRRRNPVVFDGVELTLLENGVSRLVDLAELNNESSVLIVNFWASWCTPCIKELPYFDALRRSFADQPQVTVLLVSIDMYQGDAVAAMAKANLRFPLYLDSTKEILESLTGQSDVVPATVVLNVRRGRAEVVRTLLGQLSQRSAEDIEKLVGSAIQ